jgi:hypothetical protein
MRPHEEMPSPPGVSRWDVACNAGPGPRLRRFAMRTNPPPTKETTWNAESSEVLESR